MATATASRTVTILHSEAPHIHCTAKQDIPEHGIKAGETFLLKKVGEHTYEIRCIEIIARKQLASGSISCTVRNGEDREYGVLLNRNHQHTCTCEAYTKGHQSCYHVAFVRSVENARIRALNDARRKRKAGELPYSVAPAFNKMRKSA